MEILRTAARANLPKPIRRVLGYGLNYTQRLGRWGGVLTTVRGASWADRIRLTGSALAAPWLALHELGSWQDPILLFDTAVRVPGIGRFQLRRRTDDLWHVVPWREQAIVDLLRARLGPGMTFVDAGANIGVYSVLASQLVGHAGKVIAIEMMPPTAALLRRHIELNDCHNVDVVENALAEESGLTIMATIEGGKAGQASIVRNDRTDAERVHVTTTTLDTICESVERIDVMKMDLEGAEDLALQGAERSLEKTITIIFEAVHGGTSATAERLTQAGFKVRPLSRKDWIAER